MLEVFGKAAHVSSLEEVESLVRSDATDGRVRTRAAAFGLALVASQAVGKTEFFEDARKVLDEVAKAKAQIDIAAWPDLKVAQVADAVLSTAQKFLDAQTISCTEWPTPREVAASVLKAARHAAEV